MVHGYLNEVSLIQIWVYSFQEWIFVLEHTLRPFKIFLIQDCQHFVGEFVLSYIPWDILSILDAWYVLLIQGVGLEKFHSSHNNYYFRCHFEILAYKILFFTSLLQPSTSRTSTLNNGQYKSKSTGDTGNEPIQKIMYTVVDDKFPVYYTSYRSVR